jgi:hypothetical protein
MIVSGMPEKYGKAHGEKVAFSEFCHQLAFPEDFSLLLVFLYEPRLGGKSLFCT